ncbi:MAG: Crp/Fnr family transcriptional regulator [Deltaproteobacteria bacterium]|nr:Crp/Fnr family transcriptional regulator [Deltaproteobacteria bacterium]
MKREDLIAHLRRNEIFATASAEKVEKLANLAELLTFDKEGRILEEGDASEHLFVLVKGVVGVFYSSEDGVDVLVKIFGAPAVFGEMELIFGQPRQEYVECFEPCLVLRLPAADFMSFMRADPQACYVMLKDVASRLAIAAYNERALAFLDANTRLAGLFLSFLEAYGKRTDDGVTLQIKLTYEMLARCLGVTVRSIDRAMTEWAKQGWMTKNRGFYTFHDLEKLEDKADPERIALFSKLGLLPHRAGEFLGHGET